jgi:hypothetical protein
MMVALRVRETVDSSVVDWATDLEIVLVARWDARVAGSKVVLRVKRTGVG